MQVAIHDQYPCFFRHDSLVKKSEQENIGKWPQVRRQCNARQSEYYLAFLRNYVEEFMDMHTGKYYSIG